MSYGIFENLHSGAEAQSQRTAATRRNFATLVYQAQRDFGPYLAAAENEADLMDRVAQVEAALREDGIEEPLTVLQALAENTEDDEPEDAADDHDDDSDVPDFVDTDKDDDKERDEDSKKESANHLNPANPGGPQWQHGEYPGEKEVSAPNGLGGVAPTSPWDSKSDFTGTLLHHENGFSHSQHGTQDGAMAEVEKGLADPTAPAGRHRASKNAAWGDEFPISPSVKQQGFQDPATPMGEGVGNAAAPAPKPKYFNENDKGLAQNPAVPMGEGVHQPAAKPGAFPGAQLANESAGGGHASAGNYPVKHRIAAPMMSDSNAAVPAPEDPNADPGANAGTGAAGMGNMFGGGAATPGVQPPAAAPGLPGQAPAPAFPGQRPPAAVPNATLASKNAHRVLPVKPRINR